MKNVAVFLTLTVCFSVAARHGEIGCVLGSQLRADKRDVSWVSKRVEAWQPTKEERAFDEIGWAKDLREAQRLGKQYGRPVFLFTYDGASLSCYRC